MTAMTGEFRRHASVGGPWTITCENGALTITGGSHADAYGPVVVSIEDIDLLVSDMRMMATALSTSGSGGGLPPVTPVDEAKQMNQNNTLATPMNEEEGA